MKWSPQQEAALSDVSSWLKNPSDPVYRLFGFAGTGKTTIARHLAEDIKGTVLYGAFTGKAALVMRRNGIKNATTIHRMVYRIIPLDEVKMRELKKKRKETSDDLTSATLMQEMRDLAQPKFEINPESEVRKASLIVLDECSMVNDKMKADLQSFGKPILVLGDPGQLPPIEGEGAFTRDPPQTLLTEIHRQALDNPIIRLSVLAREGETIPFETFGESEKIRLSALKLRHIEFSNQVICGKNATRRGINKKWRAHKLFTSIYPMETERVICLKNTTIDVGSKEDEEPRQVSIFNGQPFTVSKSEEGALYTSMLLEDEEGKEVPVEAFNAYFEEYVTSGTLDNYTQYDMRGFHQFDFGYAITCHKSQGSQWPSVLVYDDHLFSKKPEDRRRWLYTSITRAEESVCIVDA